MGSRDESDLPRLGAEVRVEGGVGFRVWAPRSRRVEVVLEGGSSRDPLVFGLAREEGADGYFSGVVPEAEAGARYRYRLDGRGPFPDPASRFQPEGPLGPSMVVDPRAFRWTDGEWKGRSIRGQVIYELHVGTFTREGTWEASIGELEGLVDLGVTVLEVMPVNDFTGRFGWGYDGVNWFAPTRLYGRPDDFRQFVDRAHALGLAVILDVVYNHFGPEGMFWAEYSTDYFTDRYRNEWGASINFDGPNSGPVRGFVLANVAHWIREYHLDGLRIDATQALFDASEDSITRAIARVVRASAGGRSTIVIAENEPQLAEIIRPLDRGGDGLDALWNDDFHHAARVLATGRREGYLADYRGCPQEFVSAFKHGFLFQGQYNARQGKRRGVSARDISREGFVWFLQNHDQVANSHRGERIHQLASPALYRALTAVLLLTPGTPMLFQGQEFAASSPFFYFADHEPELGRLTREGRISFLGQFGSLKLPETVATLAEPGAVETFQRSKLDQSERSSHAREYRLHRDLIRLRREDPTLSQQGLHGIDGAVLGRTSFAIRYFGELPRQDRLLVVNLGVDELEESPAEPLLASPEGCGWELLWTSEAVCYGGSGTTHPETDEGWWLQGRSAVLLAPAEGRNLEPVPGPRAAYCDQQPRKDGEHGDDR